MKFILIFIITGIIIQSNLKAQNSFQFRTDQLINDYELVVNAMEKLKPGYRQEINNWYNSVLENLQNEQSTRASGFVLNIPVVVHVV